MAASACNRDLVYYTFDNEELCESLHDIHAYLTKRSVTVGRLYDLLLKFGSAVSVPNFRLSLFDFLYQELESYNLDTESEGETAVETGQPPEAETPSGPKRKPAPTAGSQERQTKMANHGSVTSAGSMAASFEPMQLGAVQKQPADLTFTVKVAEGSQSDGFVFDASEFPDLGNSAGKKTSPSAKQQKKISDFFLPGKSD
jgi:hypothetical protein